jgi:DNA-binding transcriptional MerR regulator
MGANLTIGDFAKVTHLSVKTLRHYHRVGLLEPAAVDPSSGYRYYSTAQVPTAQVIRRFRELDMPVEQLRAVLDAPDLSTRNALVEAHLARMEEQLRRTRESVGALRALLSDSAPAPAIAYRTVPPTPVLAVSARVGLGELSEWCTASLAELGTALRERGVHPGGPPGGLYEHGLFEHEVGDATFFVPVTDPAAANLTLPGVELATSVHEGPYAELDRTYGGLGSHVMERAIGIEGPVRESYLRSSWDTPDDSKFRTEVGWPVFRTRPGSVTQESTTEGAAS